MHTKANMLGSGARDGLMLPIAAPSWKQRKIVGIDDAVIIEIARSPRRPTSSRNHGGQIGVVHRAVQINIARQSVFDVDDISRARHGAKIDKLA